TALPADVSRFYVEYDEVNLVIHAPSVLKVLTFLRDDPSCLFVCPIDVTGVDYPSREKRFDVVYHLLSPHHNSRIRVKAALGEGETIASAVGLYPGLLWFEREAYDMFGIHFAGHPDLRRLLTDYGFTGHPLRKDFPMTGFVEVRYDDDKKKVVYEPVALSQDYRNFDFLSPWEGGTPLQLPGDEKAGG
ncbi:MAG: NADH-quinone oxidoreductase subunit C, partial [Alphaproteobacteria bacterium]|nr:NADH-quinone oxidoreductase subunit C [Alphaproteobacteria bacterium]